MKLRVHLSANYKLTEIPNIQTANPSYSKIEATKHFVENKYGDWIASNMKDAVDDYVFIVESTEHFDVDFDHSKHADKFRSQLGGSVM